MPSSRAENKSPRPLRTGRRLFVIFSITVLAPGLILGVFGLRALTRERQDAERQLRERFDVVAENIGRRLELELRDWQQAVEEVALSGSEDPAQWPERVRNAVAEPGAGVVLLRNGEEVQAYPDGQLLYLLSPLPEEIHTDEAESLEVRSNTTRRSPCTKRGRPQQSLPNGLAP